VTVSVVQAWQAFRAGDDHCVNPGFSAAAAAEGAKGGGKRVRTNQRRETIFFTNLVVLDLVIDITPQDFNSLRDTPAEGGITRVKTDRW